MGLQKSNGDLQKSRRLGFTFTFHFNVIEQLQSFVSVKYVLISTKDYNYIVSRVGGQLNVVTKFIG
jgi:hypothetical protein